MTVRTLLMLALAGTCVSTLSASSVLCSTGPTAGSLVATSCAQAFTSTDFLNWGAPVWEGGLGEAYLPGATEIDQLATVATNNGLIIDASTNMGLVRADNTVYSWDSATSRWVAPANLNTFAGHFDAPSYQTSSAPYGPNNLQSPYGDDLLGVTGGAFDPGADPSLTLMFSQTIYGVSFDVSSASSANFIATLDAYGSSGNLLGVYQVNSNGTGVGGTCSGLSSTPPVPCNNAPLIQFYDPEGRIATVVLTLNDTNGMYIDELGLTSFADPAPLDPGNPEPPSAPLIGAGLIVVALVAKHTSRKRQTQQPSSSR